MIQKERPRDPITEFFYLASRQKIELKPMNVFVREPMGLSHLIDSVLDSSAATLKFLNKKADPEKLVTQILIGGSSFLGVTSIITQLDLSDRVKRVKSTRFLKSIGVLENSTNNGTAYTDTQLLSALEGSKARDLTPRIRIPSTEDINPVRFNTSLTGIDLTLYPTFDINLEQDGSIENLGLDLSMVHIGQKAFAASFAARYPELVR